MKRIFKVLLVISTLGVVLLSSTFVFATSCKNDDISLSNNAVKKPEPFRLPIDDDKDKLFTNINKS